MNIDTIKYWMQNPGNFVVSMGSKGKLNFLPDRLYLSLVYRLTLGRWPKLDKPESYNEKLNWLKLYDRKPEYSRLVDKYAVREFVAEKIGADYLIPLVGGPWNSVDEIDFDALPEQFVLKTTHDSGGVIICRDKQSFDVEAAKRRLRARMEREYYHGQREWHYKNVPHRIIAEKYMQDGENKSLVDLKFFCFNGEPKIMYIAQEEIANSPADYFDMDFNHLDMQIGPDPWAEICPEKPRDFEKMVEFARLLSSNIPQLRVDFYSINGRIYFGELTFFHNGGYSEFKPAHWDELLGSWIELPEKTV